MNNNYNFILYKSANDSIISAVNFNKSKFETKKRSQTIEMVA